MQIKIVFFFLALVTSMNFALAEKDDVKTKGVKKKTFKKIKSIKKWKKMKLRSYYTIKGVDKNQDKCQVDVLRTWYINDNDDDVDVIQFTINDDERSRVDIWDLTDRESYRQVQEGKNKGDIILKDSNRHMGYGKIWETYLTFSKQGKFKSILKQTRYGEWDLDASPYKFNEDRVEVKASCYF